MLRLFDRLNGSSEDTLSIEYPDHGSMLIGGGPERFIAVCFLPDGASLHAEKNKEEGMVLIQVGGQIGDYPARNVLDRVTAVEVAKDYLRDHTMATSLAWIRDVAPEKNWSEYSDKQTA
jgi:hypothetical protein